MKRTRPQTRLLSAHNSKQPTVTGISASNLTAAPTLLFSSGNTSVESVSENLSGHVYYDNVTVRDGDNNVTYTTEILVYVPDVDSGEYGERPTASPILVVYGNAPYTAETALQTSLSSGLAAIADHEHGPVVFVNPSNGESWTADDAISMYAVKCRYSDSSSIAYHKNGKSAEADGSTYPGSYTRLLVFAEGSGADFAYENLASGVVGRGQFFGSTLWQPTALYLEHVSSTIDELPLLKKATFVPTVIVDGSDAAVHGINKLNGFKHVHTLSGSGDKTGFSSNTLVSAYDEVMEHWMIRDSCSFDCYHSLVCISDYQQAGIMVARNDHSFSGNTAEPLTYYSWVKQNSIDAYYADPSVKVPLVIVFHGSDNSAEFQVWSAGWAEQMLCDTLAVISFDDYSSYTNAQFIETIQSYISANPWIDTSRIYLTGFSLGSLKTWSLGFEYPEFFAGLIPTAGFGSVDIPTSIEMPVFMTGGVSSYIRSFEFPSSDEQYTTFAQLLKLNGISTSYTFDADADPLWGLHPTLTCSKTLDVYKPAMTLTLNAYQNKDGRWLLGTLSGDVTAHEPLREMTYIAWAYVKQFRRNADGTISGGSMAPDIVGY